MDLIEITDSDDTVHEMATDVSCKSREEESACGGEETGAAIVVALGGLSPSSRGER